MITDSRSSLGWNGPPSIWVRWLSFQLSFKTEKLFGPRSSRTGSRRRSVTPNWESDGPIPRSTTAFDACPVMINPPIITLSPVSVRRRVERFNAWAGVAVGVAVGGAGGGGVWGGAGSPKGFLAWLWGGVSHAAFWCPL